MGAQAKLIQIRERRKNRVREKIKAANRRGLARIYFHVSSRHMYAQVIDANGRTLMAVSTLDEKLGKAPANKETAVKLADLLVERAQAKSLDLAAGFIFDRGEKLYHGKVKAFAEQLREKGVKI